MSVSHPRNERVREQRYWQIQAEPEDEDNMEEIDSTNIINTRTRGKTIDFAKANQELGDDEDEDDDEDFVDPDDEMKE
jgi:hypothetical protein